MSANLIEAARPSPSCGRAVMGELRGRTIDDLDADQGELFAPIGSIVESTFLSTSNLESSFMAAVVQSC
jgi:hypothetical protein